MIEGSNKGLAAYVVKTTQWRLGKEERKENSINGNTSAICRAQGRES